jgi:cyclopropane fatty-acyl-phospholipid synthase-like methyltransferase
MTMLPFSDACERNKAPILRVLQTAFVGRTQVLEIGSGTGQHAVYFAAHLNHLTWHPTERLAHLPDLAARIKSEGPPNLQPATVLDVTQAVWPVRSVDAAYTANTLHIMAWSEVLAMFRGLDAVLTSNGIVCIYGPFRYDGRYTSESNREFDRMLKDRDPLSGLRDLSEVSAAAGLCGLKLRVDHDLPANNRLLEFVRGEG